MWAISVKQPFAIAIIHCGKFIENRTWLPKQLKIGDRLAIIASKTWYPTYKDGRQVRWQAIERDLKICGATRIPSQEEYLFGGLIGTVAYGGAYRHRHMDTKWAMEGQYHWLLSDPQPLPFRPVKGQLGLYQIDLT